MPQFNEGRAILIGVGEYATANLEQVTLTVNEAQDIAKVLQDSETAAYPPWHVQLLVNRNATLKNIINALQDLASRTTAEDTVFLYVASHGALSTQGEYHFATYDVKQNPTREIVQDSGLSATRLQELLDGIKAKKLLVLINTCLSGHVTGTLSTKSGAMPPPTLNYQILATGQGRAVITACRGSQSSFFSRNDTAYTYFGRAVIDALSGKNVRAESGYIGLFEFYSAIYDTVVNSAKSYNESQEPTLTLSQGVGPFPIALYLGGKQGALRAEELKQGAPTDKAVEQVPPHVIETYRLTTIQAVGAGAQAAGEIALRVEGTGNVGIGKMISLDGAKIGGDFRIGKMAGRDIIEISGATTEQKEILKQIEELRSEIAQLKGVPPGKVEDAQDELRKAQQAGETGDKERMLEKLDAAKKIIVGLGATLPAAIKLGETIGALLLRVTSLWV